MAEIAAYVVIGVAVVLVVGLAVAGGWAEFSKHDPRGPGAAR